MNDGGAIARTRRDRMIRGVLVIGGLTAIATSAPPSFTREGLGAVRFAAGETHRVTVTATESARHGSVGLQFTARAHLSDPSSRITLQIVPEFEGLDPLTLSLSPPPLAPGSCTSCKAGTSGAQQQLDDDAGLEPKPPPQAGRGAALPETSSSESTGVNVAEGSSACPEPGNCQLRFRIERLLQPTDRGEEVALTVSGSVSRSSGGGCMFCGGGGDGDFDSKAQVAVQTE